MPPLISVVTPSYNQAAFLEKTILSVIRQNYPNLEYFIVDGGSTDGSVEIIEKYADQQKYPSPLSWWVSESDSGQAEAINKGFRRAQGEFVTWLNSDDLFLPDTLAQAAAVLEANHQLGFVFGNALTIDPQGGILNGLVFRDWGFKELLRFHIICQPSVIMRREVLERAGYLDQSYHFMLDHHLWLRMARLAPIQHLDCFLSAARQHPSAKNVSQAPKFGEEALRLLDWLEYDPEFSPFVMRDRRKIEAGAYRLNGRYLLDGGLYRHSLRSYTRAMLRWPGYTLNHWRRISFTLLNIFGLHSVTRNLAASFMPSAKGNRPSELTHVRGKVLPAGLEDWL